MKETKLDRVISDVAYILDSLMVLRNIQETHNCYECANRGCEWEPKPGQMVRYNCPHYVSKDGRAVDGGC